MYIYISSNLHPSPNSRWLHHTALRYVRRAQSGAYMWWKGLNSVKTGSKRAKNTCLSIANGLGSLLEKRVFDPFLTHFLSQNGPFSRHFGSFQEPKPVPTGSKWAKTTCLSIINGPGSLLEKRVFDPFVTHCWSQNGPFSRHFGSFQEPKPVPTGSKWAKTTCLSIINGPRSFLEKRVFDPFLTHCWSQNGPFSRHFGIFHGPKRATTGSKWPTNTCLSIPSGLGTTLEKIFFFALGTWWTHRWPPLCVGWPALRLHQVTTGTGVYVSRWAILRLGNHKKWGVAGGLAALGIRF